MADFTNRTNGGFPALVTGNRDVISSSSIYRWLMEGKCFEAGFGPEDDLIENTKDTLSEEGALVGLQSTASSTTLVIPLLLRLFLTNDGGGVTTTYVTWTRPAADCATANTLSGTAFTFKRNLNRCYASQGTASPLYTITSAALTNADYVCFDQRVVMNNSLAATHLSGSTGAMELDFMREGLPAVLCNKAALLVYSTTGTSVCKSRAYIQWAEVTINDLY